MVKKINSKTETKIEADSFEIVACRNKEQQAFLNVFHFQGETFSKSQLGQLFGVIQVHDHSEQSQYLPNLIAQIIKKEFYKNSKRSTEECFEAALHKANSALAELAQHELVSWHGKLDAVIGASNDDQFLFTQSSGGKIFLIRNKKISEISKGLHEPTDNPLKTFSNVSAGIIDKEDKIIFATGSINESFSMDDLKRHANTFSSDELDNLLKSTIETEGDNMGMVVVNFRQKIAPLNATNVTKDIKNLNFFGNSPKDPSKPVADEKFKTEKFQEVDPATAIQTDQKDSDAAAENRSDLSAEKTDSSQNILFSKQDKIETRHQAKEEKQLSPFEKQPELFIKEEDPEENLKENNFKDHNLSFTKKNNSLFNKLNQTFSFQKVQEATSALKAKTSKIGAKQSKNVLTKAKEVEKFSNDKKTIIPSAQELSSEMPAERKDYAQTDQPSMEQQRQEMTFDMINSANNPLDNLPGSGHTDETDHKLANFWENTDSNAHEHQGNAVGKLISKKQLSDTKKKIIDGTKGFAGNLSIKMRSAANKQKTPLLMIGVVIFIIAVLVGIFLAVISFRGKDQSAPQQDQDQNEPSGQNDQVSIKEEKANIEKLADLESEVISLTHDDGEIFMLTSLNSIYRYDTHNGTIDEISIGTRIRGVEKIDSIDNLNMILLVSKDAVLSYLRVTKSFDENKIDMPENAQIVGTGSYLSFFYLLDRTSGQIYRYPRAEGGFGAPKLWLTNSIDASKATTIAVDDSIRVGYDDGRIEKYFKSKQESSFLLDSSPKIIPHKIAAKSDHDKYYVLDRDLGAVAVVNKDNNQVQMTYRDEMLKGAKDIHFVVQENKIYFISRNAQLMRLSLD